MYQVYSPRMSCVKFFFLFAQRTETRRFLHPFEFESGTHNVITADGCILFAEHIVLDINAPDSSQSKREILVKMITFGEGTS